MGSPLFEPAGSRYRADRRSQNLDYRNFRPVFLTTTRLDRFLWSRLIAGVPRAVTTGSGSTAEPAKIAVHEQRLPASRGFFAQSSRPGNGRLPSPLQTSRRESRRVLGRRRFSRNALVRKMDQSARMGVALREMVRRRQNQHLL